MRMIIKMCYFDSKHPITRLSPGGAPINYDDNEYNDNDEHDIYENIDDDDDDKGYMSRTNICFLGIA